MTKHSGRGADRETSSYKAVTLLFVVLTDFHAAYLPADGLGQFVHKLDDARILIGSRDALHVVLKLLDEIVARPRFTWF